MEKKGCVVAVLATSIHDATPTQNMSILHTLESASNQSQFSSLPFSSPSTSVEKNGHVQSAYNPYFSACFSVGTMFFSHKKISRNSITTRF
jgi:hypothetical protein